MNANRNCLNRKGMVLVVLCLFVGAGALPNISGNIGKTINYEEGKLSSVNCGTNEKSPNWIFPTGADVISIDVSDDGQYIAVGSLGNKLYLLNTIASYNEILHSTSRGTKRKLDENSTLLWHKRLSHIFKQRKKGLCQMEFFIL